MKGALNYRIAWGLVALIGLMIVVPVSAQDKCGVCGAALSDRAVRVTDWETNKEHRYHDLSCAVREMAMRFAWSRAVTQSAAANQRITLTRINTTWRAEPEEAVFVALAPKEEQCENTLVFASAREFRAYAEKKGTIPPDARAMPLTQLPAQLMASAPRPTPAEERAAPQADQPEAKATAGSTGFKDVPLDHWAAKFVEKARALGLMQGYPDGTFRGGEALTRYEMAAILSALAERGFFGEQREGAARESILPAPDMPKEEREAPKGPKRRPTAEAVKQRPGATASFLGLSGPLSVPSARIQQTGNASFIAGGLNRRFVAAGTMGIGGRIELGAASARLAGEDRVFVSGKARLERLSRPGLDVAAGFTGFGTDTSVFAVGTTKWRTGKKSTQVSAGLGTGGILDGFFAAAAIPVSERLMLAAESANLGDGRHFNYGLDMRLRPHLNVRVGRVDGDAAGSVALAREF